MKSDMKNNLFCLVVLGLGLMLGACVKDDPTGPGTPFRFNISIRDPQVVETRSAATGGELTIESAEGEGSTFTFTIAKEQPRSETVEDTSGGIARP